ncbi:MAG: YidC/Oxa1 family membrane protein insertase [Ruminococcaceae bacterium]|nr:YidC/Oxa1 family membrane protein insertase [Oscillospiraceae bacterium]
MKNFIITPFAWVLEQFYNLSGNYIVALFFFAVVFKLILLPSSISQQKGAAKQQRLQPKIRRIQARYAGDQKKIQEETQALYQREGYNPMSAQGCLPMLIQLPIIFILYDVIYKPLSYVLKVPAETITKMSNVLEKAGVTLGEDRFLEMSIMDNFEKAASAVPDYADKIRGLIDSFSFGDVLLTTKPSFSALTNWGTSTSGDKLLLLIPLLSGLTALLTSLITQAKQKKQNPEMAKNPTMGCMTYSMPIMSLVFTFSFPAGIGVYWIFQNILSAIQMVILNRVYSNEKVMSKVLVVETIQRRSKENNIKMVSKIKEDKE